MKLLSSAAVRRCVVPDEGYAIISADFDQIEWRVIAGLSGEQSMIDAAKRGESIHKLAAVRLFGEDYNPDQYKRTKNINFTWAFGGGAGTMVRRYDIPFAEAHALISDYTKAFPTLNAYKKKQIDRVYRAALTPGQYNRMKSLQRKLWEFDTRSVAGRVAQARVKVEINRLLVGKVARVENPFGRMLVIDAFKAYTIVNHLVQSTAADIMKMALLDVMADEECEPTVLLPIHDEILGQAPIHSAQYIVDRYAKIMTREFNGVPITASGEVYGESWGHGYMGKR